MLRWRIIRSGVSLILSLSEWFFWNSVVFLVMGSSGEAFEMSLLGIPFSGHLGQPISTEQSFLIDSTFSLPTPLVMLNCSNFSEIKLTNTGDDLSMLIATATVLHRVFTFDKSLSTTVISGIAITAVMTVFSTWHCITDEIVMHSVLFGNFPRSFFFSAHPLLQNSESRLQD